MFDKDKVLKTKAEESYWNSDAHGGLSSKKNYVLGFIDGAKENGVIWHDLKKNPDDLPEEGAEVLNDDGVKVVRIKGHWRYVYGAEWEDDAHLDHWCKLPKFEVE